MINRQVFKQIVGEAQDALLQYHLNDAIFLITSLLKEIDSEELAREFESIERDYTAMLTFLANGGQDAAQEEMQAGMVCKTYLLLNKIDICFSQKQDDDYIGQCHKQYITQQMLYGSYTDESSMPLRTIDATEGFLMGLESTVCTPNLSRSLNIALKSSTSDTRKSIISGMALAIWSRFSPQALSILAEYASTEPRALVTLVMVAIKYPRLLKLFPESEELLKRTLQAPENSEWVFRTNREIFMSAQSETLERKIRNELIPKLIDGAKDERLRMGFDFDEDDNDAFEKMMKKSLAPTDKKTEKKQQQFMASAMQLLDMQQEGVDINTEMFVNSMRMPFFQNLSNWFLPFDAKHESIRSITYPDGKPNILLKMILEQGKMCDIDLYAVTLMLGETFKNSMVKEMLNMMKGQMQEAEAVTGEDYKREPVTAEQEIMGFVRVLYRLFVKSKWKNQLTNLFSYSINFLDNELLKPVFLNNTKLLSNMGQLMYKYERHDEAYAYLKQHEKLEGSDANSLSMMATCLQTMGKYRQAANLLIQADILDPNNAVTLGQLVSCYQRMECNEEHLDCLLRLEQLMPESSKIITETGLCLMKLGRYQEASQRFYKLEVEEKKVVPSMRAIAWCSFKQNKYDTALRYYKKIYNTPNAATWEDYLNGGHTSWLLGDMQSALTLYHQYIKRYLTDDPKITDSLTPFDKDAPELMLHGKKQREIDLMHELIMHNEKSL